MTFEHYVDQLEHSPSVHIVGAGPGDPDLLTIKAHRLIRAADVILHDDLVSAEVVALAAARALIVNVGKRCGEKKITQEEINRLMVEYARQGLQVVRLKSGDPGVFGRLAEEIDALESAGIFYEIVPGITAGIAAAASMGASLTDRRSSSRIIVITGHQAHVQGGGENFSTSGADWRGLAREDATFVIYMPGRNLQRLQHDLLDAGFAPDFPVVIASRVSSPDQREWPTTLAELDDAPPMEAPSILLLGRTFARTNRKATASLVALAAQNCSSSSRPEFT
jgi:uroporphyrin-III C-methyltransferase